MKKSLLFLSIAALTVFGACSSDAGKGNTATTDQTPDGKAIFKTKCQVCHGADGKLGLNGALDLTVSALSVEQRIEVIRNGRNLMTPFVGILSDAEIKAVADYTMTLK